MVGQQEVDIPPGRVWSTFRVARNPPEIWGGKK